MVDLKSYFPQIGSSGEKPTDGKTWSPGDNYYAAHLTYLWDQVRKRFGDVENRLNAIDSDDDGVSMKLIMQMTLMQALTKVMTSTLMEMGL